MLARPAAPVPAPPRLSTDCASYSSTVSTSTAEGDRPASVRGFTAEVASTDALLVLTPEHNPSIPAVLKNAIDWGSKPMDQNVWRGKPAAITGTSPGAIGAAVGQQHLRQILGILGATVMGGEAYISFRPDLL